ncbi:MAG: hypothetical protein M3Y32_10460 [Pseudomonadota bacterium]|nr:hypothetical protein [Pseudomonadota bacterium]
MKFPMFALSAIGASLAMLSSAPAFAATQAGTTDSSMAAPATPKGEKSTENQGKGRAVPMASDTTRSEVKHEAAVANKNGTALPAGENVTEVPGQKQVKHSKMSHKSRSEVKSKAAMANKDGTAVPAGEASSKAQEKGQKQ